MGAIKRSEIQLEELAEKLTEIFQGEIEYQEDEVLGDPDFYEDYFCDIDDNDVREKAEDYLLDYMREHTDLVVESDDIPVDLIDDLLHHSEIVIGSGYHYGGDYPLEGVALYGDEYEMSIALPDDILAALKLLNAVALKKLKRFVSCEVEDYINQCIKAREDAQDLPAVAWLYCSYPGTPTLTLTEGQLEVAAEALKEEISRVKATHEIARQWKARNSRFACIDGGKSYSTKELMKYREARRKRLTSKYQTKKVR